MNISTLHLCTFHSSSVSTLHDGYDYTYAHKDQRPVNKILHLQTAIVLLGQNSLLLDLGFL